MALPGLQSQGISIHALREEGDQSSVCSSSMDLIFLSTPSARRATVKKKSPSARFAISIHALREEGDDRDVRGVADLQQISIHALREEGDRGLPIAFRLP